MKIAFFDPATGQAVRLYRGKDADAERVKAEPRHAHHQARDLEGTRWAGVMDHTVLPDLAAFDAGAPPAPAAFS